MHTAYYTEFVAIAGYSYNVIPNAYGCISAVELVDLSEGGDRGLRGWVRPHLWRAHELQCHQRLL